MTVKENRSFTPLPADEQVPVDSRLFADSRFFTDSRIGAANTPATHDEAAQCSPAGTNTHTDHSRNDGLSAQRRRLLIVDENWW